MQKRELKSNLTIYPTPVVLVSCGLPDEKPNIITLAWAGVVNSIPEMVSISIRPSRHSAGIIDSTGEFVVNIPNAGQVKEVDICGTVSGRVHNKFEMCRFTPQASTQIDAPMIAECPVNLECKVKKTLDLGSHRVYIGEIVCKHIDEDMADERGLPAHEKLNPICFTAPNYYAVTGGKIGHSGFSKKGYNK